MDDSLLINLPEVSRDFCYLSGLSWNAFFQKHPSPVNPGIHILHKLCHILPINQADGTIRVGRMVMNDCSSTRR